MKEQELFALKEELEKAKPKYSELKGEKQSLMKRLAEEWGCESLKEAKKEIEKAEQAIEAISSEINEGLIELDEKLDYGT